MASLNKILLIGRLAKDPEIRQTTSGKSVCSFSLATDEGFGDKKRTEWHNIVLWEKTAEIAEKYLFKGSLVYIEGRLQTRSYEKDGAKIYRTEIIGYKMQMLSPKEGGTQGQATCGDNLPPDEDPIPF
jgi:single-strand DNA-binding protein